MSVRVAIDGKFDEQKDGGLKFSGSGGELTAITSMAMDFALETGLSECKACCLVIRVTRDASHGTKEDLLAAKYQSGKGNRGDEWRFTGEVWLIDDKASGPQATVGRFELYNAQVIAVEPRDADGPPTEDVTIHAYEWMYIDIRGGNKPLNRVKAHDAPALPKK